MSMRRVAVLTATAVVLVGNSVLMASEASADDTTPPAISSVDVRPEPVGLYKSGSTKITVDVKVTDEVGVTSVHVYLHAVPRDPDDTEYPDTVVTWASLVSGTAQEGSWRGTLSLDKADTTGMWTTELGVRDAADNGQFAGRVYDEGYEVPPIDDFYVKRNTMIRDFNVAEPVVRGAFVRMYGRLVRLDPTRGYVGYQGKAMRVLFRPTGSTTWIDRGAVTTNARGYFANFHMFRAWRDGIWKVRFDGTANYLPESSHGDFVEVR